MKLYHVNLNREVVLPYGTGTERIRDTYWTMPDIKQYCRNAAVLSGKKGITGITVVKRFDGCGDILQFCGYTMNTGMYGYMVNDDGTLERFC